MNNAHDNKQEQCNKGKVNPEKDDGYRDDGVPKSKSQKSFF